MVVLVIIKDLIKIAGRCLTSKIILKYFKKSIILVLRKKREGGGLFLSSYKLIIFKNI